MSKMKALWLRTSGVVIGLGSLAILVCFNLASWFGLMGVMMTGNSSDTLLVLVVLIVLNFAAWRVETRFVFAFSRRLIDRASTLSKQ